MIEQNAFNIIFGIFVLFTCRDVFYGQVGGSADSNLNQNAETDGHLTLQHGTGGLGDSPHINSVPGIPTIKIQYCQSCGYKQAFDDVSKMLLLHYPEIKIEGEVHRPSFIRSMIVNLLFIAKIAVLAMLYMDYNPFAYFNLETPAIWTYMSQSKLSSSLMILFIANSIESNMVSTGAFEIFYNDMPVWSKITTGRMPTAPELLQIVQSQMSFVQKSRIGEFLAP